MKPEAICVGFRLLQPGDAPRLRGLRHRAIRECAAQFGTPPEIELARGIDHYRRQLEEGRQRGSQAILGGWVEKDLIAMVGFRRRRTASGPVGLITSMYVDPAWRGCGTGTLLLEQAMERIESLWGLRRCHLNVEVNNEKALRLYQHCGFELKGREDNAFTIHGRSHAVYLLERN